MYSVSHFSSDTVSHCCSLTVLQTWLRGISEKYQTKPDQNIRIPKHLQTFLIFDPHSSLVSAGLRHKNYPRVNPSFNNFVLQFTCSFTVLQTWSSIVLQTEKMLIINFQLDLHNRRLPCSLRVVHCSSVTVEHCWSYSVSRTVLHSSLYSVEQTDSDTVEQTFSDTELHSCREVVLPIISVFKTLRLDWRSVPAMTEHMENNLPRPLA